MGNELPVKILRRLRHDFGNYLQVILGYIDLNQPLQAKEYILKVVENLAAEHIIFETKEDDAVLYFYEQMLKARDLGIILRYKDINIKSWKMLKEQNEPIKTLTSLASQFRRLEDDACINLTFECNGNKIKMLFEWQEPEPGHLDVLIEELK